MSCGVEIDPKFVHSIRSNVCAGCGEPLMTDSSQELMASLKDALLQMPNDPEGLAVWLLSNYDMRKVGSGEPVQRFYGTEAKYSNFNKNADESNLKIRENTIDKFYKNAGLSNINKSDLQEKLNKAKAKVNINKNYAGLAKSIQSGEDYNDIEDGEDYDDSEEFDNDIGEEEYGADFKNIDYGSLMKQVGNLSSNPDTYIQQERIERLRKQQELSNGAVGVIKRADV
jgi:hypothetical protein